MKNELIETNIKNIIYEVRGKQVMLDRDLANLYECKNGTKTINQAVGRHKDRFPEDFYFRLNIEESSKYVETQKKNSATAVNTQMSPNQTSEMVSGTSSFLIKIIPQLCLKVNVLLPINNMQNIQNNIIVTPNISRSFPFVL